MGKPEGKGLLGNLRRTWEDNIKIGVKGIRCKGVDWMRLSQEQWRAVVNMVMNLRIL
jgi:hypothetical protein